MIKMSNLPCLLLNIFLKVISAPWFLTQSEILMFWLNISFFLIDFKCFCFMIRLFCFTFQAFIM